MKLNRKLVLVMALLVSVVMGTTGTIAYLQDTDEAVNVMTLGNVDIEQYEKDAKGNDFKQNQPLYPVYEDGSTMYGAIEKVVSVENVGNTGAFVRTLLAFEAGNLDSTSFNKYIHAEFAEGVEPNWLSTPINVGGVNYYVACIDFGMLAADEVGYSLEKVYMDSSATNEIVSQFGNTYDIAVVSQAVQTTNMPNAAAAWAASFGEFNVTNAATWFQGVSAIPSTSVATAEDLTAAVAEGGTVVLAADVKLDDVMLTVAKDQNVTIDLGGHTLVGQSTADTTSKLINVAGGAKLTLKNGTVSFAATQPDVNWGGEGQPAYPGYANNTISCSGTLVIDGATIENRTARGGASYAIDCYPGADVTINSGRIDGHDKTAIRMFCNSTTVPTNVTINGGTITGSRALWLQLPGNNPDQAPPANLTVNGGTLTATRDDELSIYSYSYGQSFANVNVALNGGIFTDTVGFGGGSNKATKENVTVTGGAFLGELGRYLENDGWEDIDKPDNVTIVGKGSDLAAAVNAGKPIYLTGDIDISKIDLTGTTEDVVINGNGKKITTTDSYGIEVTNGKNITISNAEIEMTKEGDYITYAAGFKVANGDYTGKTIKLENCKITMANADWAYAVNMPVSVNNLNLVIDNCELKGAIALQCWGDNNKITITNSKLICNYTTNAQYTSYCVALQKEGSNSADNNILTIENCEFAYRGVDEFNSEIKAVVDRSGNNTVTVKNCTTDGRVTL